MQSVESLKVKVKDRMTAYKLVLGPDTPSTQMILEDLANFCRAEKSCFNADPRVHAVLEGRREVWLRIQDHLKLNFERLWQKYGGPES
jgi:hypothetical protein